METIVIEIRAGEGGLDSKYLVEDMFNIYTKAAKNNGFVIKNYEWRDAFVSIWITGNNIFKFFKNEIGCHRFQRVPPTEKYNRVQTSTITVAVLDANKKSSFKLNRNEVDKKYTCSRGKGGQNVNRIQSCVVLTHIPTGIQVRSEETRYQAKNEEIAWKRLEEKLKNIYDLNQYNNLKDIRANQIGEGERSDKRRTYREKDNLVIDHITGKKASWKDIMKGKIELLF